jgi:hypothetical protein
MGWSSSLRIGVGFKTPHCKNPAGYEILYGASDRLERSKQRNMDMILEHGM